MLAHATTFRVLFFFQAEDGIRDDLVTGVQTCALPISRRLCLTALLECEWLVIARLPSPSASELLTNKCSSPESTKTPGWLCTAYSAATMALNTALPIFPFRPSSTASSQIRRNTSRSHRQTAVPPT